MTPQVPENGSDRRVSWGGGGSDALPRAGDRAEAIGRRSREAREGDQQTGRDAADRRQPSIESRVISICAALRASVPKRYSRAVRPRDRDRGDARPRDATASAMSIGAAREPFPSDRGPPERPGLVTGQREERSLSAARRRRASRRNAASDSRRACRRAGPDVRGIPALARQRMARGEVQAHPARERVEERRQGGDPVELRVGVEERGHRLAVGLEDRVKGAEVAGIEPAALGEEVAGLDQVNVPAARAGRRAARNRCSNAAGSSPSWPRTRRRRCGRSPGPSR